MNQIKEALDLIALSPKKKAQLRNQLFSDQKTDRPHYHVKRAAVAACLLIFIMMPSVIYAAYKNGVLDQVFALNSNKRYTEIADDISKIEQYSNNQAEPVTIGDYRIEILGHMVNKDLQMGIVYYSIENENPESQEIFAVDNIYDDPKDEVSSFYMGYKKEYTEEEVTGKYLTGLVIPQTDPLENYCDLDFAADGKLYVAIRYMTVSEPFTYLNLISYQGDEHREIIGQVPLPEGKTLPTIVLTPANNQENCRILLSAFGIKLEKFDFQNGTWKYFGEDHLDILDKTQIKFQNQTIDVTEIKSRFTHTSQEEDGTTDIFKAFRLLIKLDRVESVIIDGVEFSRY